MSVFPNPGKFLLPPGFGLVYKPQAHLPHNIMTPRFLFSLQCHWGSSLLPGACGHMLAPPGSFSHGSLLLLSLYQLSNNLSGQPGSRFSYLALKHSCTISWSSKSHFLAHWLWLLATQGHVTFAIYLPICMTLGRIGVGIPGELF